LAPAAPPAGPPPVSTHAGAVAVAAGIAHWDTDGSVVFDTLSAPDSEPDEPALQRQVDAGAPSPAPQDTWVPSAPVVSRYTGPQSSPAAGPDWPEGMTWDELVHRLHEEIRWQLRAELRQDAERFGWRSGIQ
jgi:hypothetical protein